MRNLVFAVLLCCNTSIGCVVPELRNDQDKIRSALLDLYTNQIIDNLIRASDGMPIIQLDYTNATGTVTLKETANAGDTSANTGTNMLALPAKTLNITHSVVS